MLIRAFLLMQSAWSTLRQRSMLEAIDKRERNAIRMEHAEAKTRLPGASMRCWDAIRMEHAEAKNLCSPRWERRQHAIRMEHAEAKLRFLTL